MKRIFTIILSLSLLLTLAMGMTGCGLSEKQQGFVDEVNAIDAQSDTYAEAVADAFLSYEALSSEERQAEEVDAAHTMLMDHYTTLYGKLANLIEFLNIQMENYQMEQVYNSAEEGLALAEQMRRIPLQEAIDEVNQQYDLATMDECITLLQDIQETVTTMCYADTFVLRFEYHEEFPASYIEELDTCYSYGYTRKYTMIEHYNSYISYLSDNFTLSTTEDDAYIFDLGNGQQLKVSEFVIDSWDIYAVWVYPPVLG